MRGVENFFEQLLEPLFEIVFILADVADGLFSKAKRGVVVVAAGVLDENEGGGDGCWVIGVG